MRNNIGDICALNWEFNATTKIDWRTIELLLLLFIYARLLNFFIFLLIRGVNIENLLSIIGTIFHYFTNLLFYLYFRSHFFFFLIFQKTSHNKFCTWFIFLPLSNLRIYYLSLMSTQASKYTRIVSALSLGEIPSINIAWVSSVNRGVPEDQPSDL